MNDRTRRHWHRDHRTGSVTHGDHRTGPVTHGDHRTGPTTQSVDAMRRITRPLEASCALLSLTSSLVLAFGTHQNASAVLAMIFTLAGYVMVDYLRWFAMPTAAAYAAMFVVGMYCVGDFLPLDQAGPRQMIAVANLLALVQSIVMLQVKTRKLFEQLLTLCLLQWVVAAAFDNALSFGLLLLPLAIVAVVATTLLAATHCTEGSDRLAPEEALGPEGGFAAEGAMDGGNPTVSNPSAFGTGRRDAVMLGLTRGEKTTKLGGVPARWSAADNVYRTSQMVPRILLMGLLISIVPVTWIGVVFFYVLPRTTQASSMPRGPASVGFSDEVRLDQIGKMNTNASIALRVQLRGPDAQHYQTTDPLYLRGRVLGRYSQKTLADRQIAMWSEMPTFRSETISSLPKPYPAAASTPDQRYDSVAVRISAESSRSAALFTLPPYYDSGATDMTPVQHLVTRCTLQRRRGQNAWFGRTTYSMRTHGFYRGQSSRWLSFDAGLPDANEVVADSEEIRTPPRSTATSDHRRKRHSMLDSRWAEDYRDELTEVDRRAIPTADRLARQLRLDRRGRRRDAYEFAMAVNEHFRSSNQYAYTLNLDARPPMGVDPVEQFLAETKVGHCQFFASALALTLRCGGVPSRLVVGYNTDEFSSLTHRYIARGSHAHAWVEALIPTEDVPSSANLAGQPPSSFYWLRLDPTPVARLEAIADAGGNATLDLAKDIWDDYVVEMDRGRQQDLLVTNDTSMHRGYVRLVKRMANLAGSLSTEDMEVTRYASSGFSIVAAIATFVTITTLLLLLKFGPSIRRHRHHKAGRTAAEPQLDFYRDALKMLRSVGMDRSAQQTPRELSKEVADDDRINREAAKSFAELSDWYYRLRFGRSTSGTNDSNQTIDSELVRLRRSLVPTERSVD